MASQIQSNGKGLNVTALAPVTSQVARKKARQAAEIWKRQHSDLSQRKAELQYGERREGRHDQSVGLKLVSPAVSDIGEQWQPSGFVTYVEAFIALSSSQNENYQGRSVG